MKAFITKYALTSGIHKADGETFGSNGFAYHGRGFTGHVHGPDWHRDKPAAVARAEEMRLSAITSLKKKLAKLEKMSFTE